MLRNLPRLKLNFELDFEWSFRPIILFLSFFGVDLSLPSDDSKFSRLKLWLNHLYALVWLVIFTSGINYYYFFFSYIGNYSKLTPIYTYTFNALEMIAHVGCHFNLLFFIRPRFANLMKSFHLLENEHNDQRIFIRVRRFVLFSLTFALLLVSLLLSAKLLQ